VQVVEPPEVTLVGLQLNEVSAMGVTVPMVPPVAAIVMAPPLAELAIGLLTLMVVPVEEDDRVAVRTATTPFAIRLVLSTPPLSPVRKQV